MANDKTNKEGSTEQLPETPQEFASVDPSLLFKNVSTQWEDSPIEQYPLVTEGFKEEPNPNEDGNPLDQYVLSLPDVDNSYHQASRKDVDADLLAKKYKFADKENALPPIDVTKHMLVTRRDGDLEQILSDVEVIKNREERNSYIRDILKQHPNLPLETIQTIQGMNTNQFRDFLDNPKVVLEKAYADAVFNQALFSRVLDSTTPVGQQISDPKFQDKLDAGAEVLAKKEIINNILKDLMDDFSERSYLGKGASIVGSFIPFMGQIREGSQVTNVSIGSRFLKGANRDAQFRALWMLPVDQFKETLKKVLGNVGTGFFSNDVNTIDFLQALAGYSDSDEFWDNVFGGVDVATTLPLKTAGRLVGLGRGSRLGSGADKVEQASKVISTPSSTTVVKGLTPEQLTKFEKDIKDIANKRLKANPPKSGLVLVDRFPASSLVDDSDFVLKTNGGQLIEIANPNTIKLGNDIGDDQIIKGTKVVGDNQLDQLDHIFKNREIVPTINGVGDESFALKGSKVVSDTQLEQIKQAWADVIEQQIRQQVEALETEKKIRALIEKPKVSVNGKPVNKVVNISAEEANNNVPQLRLIRGIINATDPNNPNPARVLEAGGDLNNAGKAGAAQLVQVNTNTVVTGQPPTLPQMVQSTFIPSSHVPSLPSFTNGTVLSNNQARTLHGLISNALGRATRAVTGDDTLKVQRLPHAALMTAFKEADEYLLQRLAYASQSLLNIATERVAPTATKTNVGYVEWKMGKPDGTLFADQRQARHYAMVWYDLGGRRLRARDVGQQNIGLSDKEFTLVNEGNGWSINVRRNLDESTPDVRASLNVDPITNAPGGFKNSWMGRFIFGDRNFTSNFETLNRRTATSRTGEIRYLAKQLIEDPFRVLSKQERKDFTSFIDYNRTLPDPNDPTKIGRYFLNVFDMETEFRNLLGRAPSVKEIDAYFSWKAANDFDYYLRNNNLYKERAILGIEHYTTSINHMKPDPQTGQMVLQTVKPEINARIVKSIPWESRHEATIAIVDPRVSGTPTNITYIKLSKATPQEKAMIDDLVNMKNHSILQVENSADKGMMSLLNTDDIRANYVVIRDYKRQPLRYKQLPYNPGSHLEYSTDMFIKQPKMVKVGNDWEYRGDITILGQHTQAEAVKFAKAFETARVMLKNNQIGQLTTHLGNNLPYTLNEFKGLFTAHNPNGGVLDVNAPILYTKSGSYTSDIHSKTLNSHYTNFKDMIRNEHNLMNDIDKKFLGQRDPILHTIKEKGTPGNPLFSLQPASLVNPLHTVADAMANSARNSFFGDYKVSAVTSWIDNYRHILNNLPEDTRANPMKALYEPSYKENIVNRDIINQAENNRRAIINLLGTSSEAGTEMENLNMKLMNTFYKGFGQKTSDWIAEHELSFIKNPVSFARQMVFHPTMGLFNYLQFFTQAATYANIAMISPKYGMKAGGIIYPLRVAMFSDNPHNITNLGPIARTFGWSQSEFDEVVKELRNSGWYRIEGDHTYVDAIKGAGRVESGVTTVLDKGLTFFREGERFSRLAAYATSYLEWKAANPNRALDNFGRQKILDRASTLTGNMTRDADSLWQRGYLSLPTQFMSYPVRMAELMLGKELTKAEKARLFLFNGALYGVPAAFTLGLPFNFHDMIKSKLYDNGYDVDASPITHALFEGIPAVLSKALMGKDYNIQRYGPGGIKLFEDLMKGDKGIMDIMFGMSYGKSRDIIKSLYPVYLHLVDAFQQGTNPLNMSTFPPEDYLDVLRNISSVNNITKAYYAMKFGEIVTKGEVKIDDASSTDAFLMGAFGVNPRELDNIQLLSNVMKNKKEVVEETSKLMATYARRAIEAYSSNQPTTGDTYMRRVSILANLSDMTIDERSRAFSQALKGYEHLADKIKYEFVTKGASKQDARSRMIYGQ